MRKLSMIITKGGMLLVCKNKKKAIITKKKSEYITCVKFNFVIYM